MFFFSLSSENFPASNQLCMTFGFCRDGPGLAIKGYACHRLPWSQGHRCLLSFDNEIKQPTAWTAEQGQSVEQEEMVRPSRAEKSISLQCDAIPSTFPYIYDILKL